MNVVRLGQCVQSLYRVWCTFRSGVPVWMEWVAIATESHYVAWLLCVFGVLWLEHLINLVSW